MGRLMLNLMNGAAAGAVRASAKDDGLAAKVDGMAAAIDDALNGRKLVGQPRDGFVLMIVPAPRDGGPPRVSHYASSVTPLAVAYVLRDQLEKIEQAIAPTSPQVPFKLLSASAAAVLEQLFRSGPTSDGDVVSKPGRGELVAAGIAVHAEGWAFLTVDGVRLAVESGIADRKIARS